MSHAETLRALSSITDTGLFERLATAVLREANPLYKSLIHTGVNSRGRTIKGPLDGIAFIPGAEPPHMISAHHTTGDRDKLRQKWLHDPSTVRSKKATAQKSGLGDILKTAEIYKDERDRTPGLVGTLILTITSDPPEDVVRDAEVTARAAEITIDFWPASRIAHFLDTDPNGQYLRNEYLGITQERLSKNLLYDLSNKSLNVFSLLDNPVAWVDRNLDRALKNICKSGVTIISGESGQGKSVACYKRLSAHIGDGGFGLILPHQILSQAYSLEHAINKALIELYPSLLDSSGAEALALGFPDRPILVVIEDINKSGMAASLLEKVALWHNRNCNDTINGSWQILCPVWPQVITSLNEEVRKTVDDLVIDCSAFSIDEGTKAVAKRHELASETITNLEAEQISIALGNDPLLIALYNINEKPASSKIIKNFINNKLMQLSHAHEEFIASEYLQSILILIHKMFDNRIMQPMWSDIDKFELSADQMKMLRSIAHQGNIFRLVGDVGSQSVVFRHDRVRDWLAATAIAQDLTAEALADTFLSEPYFSRVIGLSLNKDTITPERVNYIKAVNPLALFYSLQEFSFAKSETQKAIISFIEEWLEEENTHSKTNEYLRWECLNILAHTDSPHVSKILERFKDKSWSYYMAGFRNGDLSKGIELCCRIRPGVNFPMLEQLIEYVVTKNRKRVIESLNGLLKRGILGVRERSGILRVCGYVRDSDLYNNLQYAWENETAADRLHILDDYLWACAQCCGASPAALLDPIMDAWASLSDKSENEGMPSDRDSFAMHEIKWAFQKYVPSNAIEYFIAQTDSDDLRWPITNLLNGIDHPSAVVHVAHSFAKSTSPYIFLAGDEWRRKQERHGKPMSVKSKNQLFNLWSNQGLENHLRETSFKLWSATHTENDIAALRSFEEDEVLRDPVLAQRIIRRDIVALPQLIEKIKTVKDAAYWWQFTRNIWSDELTLSLDEELSKRSHIASRKWDEFSYQSDWITSDLIMRLPIMVAESMLVKHWGHLQYSSYFVQTALYVATEKLVNLVADVVVDCPDPKSLFKYLEMHFGIKTQGHPGVTIIRQLEVLLPYMDFFEEMDFCYFSELCNKRGWFNFRKKHLDPRLQTAHRRISEYLSPERAIQSLNDMLRENHVHWIDHWVDGFLKTGASVEDVMNTVFEWVKSQDKIGLNVINLSLAVVLQIGNRSHYLELLDICAGVKDEYIDYFHNAFYLLRRRQLH